MVKKLTFFVNFHGLFCRIFNQKWTQCATTINKNQLVFLFLCLVIAAAGVVLSFDKKSINACPLFLPHQDNKFYIIFPQKKIQFRKPIVRNHSHILLFSQDLNLGITMCTHILRSDIWVKSKSFRAGYSVYAFYSFHGGLECQIY